jgi:hypothetical protein
VLTGDLVAAVGWCAAIVRAAADTVVSGALSMSPIEQPRVPASAASGRAHAPDADAVVSLVYELLDAHDDTAEMAADLELDPRWEAHLAYLRALQRKGRETLAHMCLDQAA